MKTYALGSVIGAAYLFVMQPVNAADLTVASTPPVYVPAPSWTGFYFGSQLGSIVSGARNHQIISGDGGPVAATTFGGRGGRTGIAVGEIEDPGLFYGFHAGYNWQWINAVFGFEADVSSLGSVGDVLGSARARLGYGTERFLLYGTAGLGFVSQGSGIVGVFVGGNGGNGGNGGPGGEGGAGGNGFGMRVITRDGTHLTGFAGGAGTEIKLTPQIGVGVEALYYAFDSGTRYLGLSDDFWTVRGRVTFHLGQPDASASVSAPGASTVGSWAGLYGGGHIGAIYNLSDSVIGDVVLANGESGTAGVRGIDGGGGGGGAVAFAALQKNASFIGGLHLGYNVQSLGLIYGGEADVSFGTNDSHKYLGTIRGRLGWAYQTYLLYGTAGVAFERNEAAQAIFAGNGGNGGNGGAAVAAPGGSGGLGGRALAIRADDTRAGVVAGAGLEAKLTDRVSLGFEGLYYGFRHDNVPATAGLGAGRTFVGSGNNDALVLRTRLSFSLQP